jgi:hypothetical protein
MGWTIHCVHYRRRNPRRTEPSKAGANESAPHESAAHEGRFSYDKQL